MNALITPGKTISINRSASKIARLPRGAFA